MKLDHLRITGFRGFDSAELSFERDTTVLVGINGSGKTALLDATALLLTALQRGVKTGPGASVPLQETDIRQGSNSARIEMTATILGTQRTWSLADTRSGLPNRLRNDLQGLRPAIESVQQGIEAGHPALPLGVYYPTNRAVVDIPERIRERHEFGPLAAYDGALASGKSNFRLFFEWFREQEDYENERRLADNGYRDLQLEAVRAAIGALLPEVSNLRVQRRPQRLVVDKGGATIEVGLLSDGEKCLLAMVADLARRMSLAAPTNPSPLGTDAVVLIDEIDLHLHPSWQRSVIPALRRTFQNAQFVLTTHSPQVVSEVPDRSLRVLRNWQIDPAPLPTAGRDTNRILQALMETSARPADVEQKLAELARVINDENWVAAWQQVDALRQVLGDDDPDVTYYSGLLPARVEAGLGEGDALDR